MPRLDTTRFTVELSSGGRGFLFDKTTGQVYTLNRTGALILEFLSNDAQTEEIVSAVSSRFGATEEEALADTLEFITELTNLGVLVSA